MYNGFVMAIFSTDFVMAIISTDFVMAIISTDFVIAIISTKSEQTQWYCEGSHFDKLRTDAITVWAQLWWPQLWWPRQTQWYCAISHFDRLEAEAIIWSVVVQKLQNMLSPRRWYYVVTVPFQFLWCNFVRFRHLPANLMWSGLLSAHLMCSAKPPAELM